MVVSPAVERKIKVTDSLAIRAIDFFISDG